VREAAPTCLIFSIMTLILLEITVESHLETSCDCYINE
jgi:hypothetical protein